MKLLLINPKFPESFWSFSWAIQKILTHKGTVSSPLGLATLAALCPQDWEIEILDENIEPIDWNARADIVGVCGMGVQADRQMEILRHFKGRGMFVVAGGSYASLCPEEYEGIADSVISGEAEYIFPAFCRDYLGGTPKPLYKETGTVDLKESPCPRYDLLKIHRYNKISVQFSRGCPFVCEFCDIIVMFGRTPRTKTHDQIARELDLLRSLGANEVFFVDDNFIGNRKLAKDLLNFLVEYQEKTRHRFSFGTEASVNLADDDTLLALMRRAHFNWVFMGIESPSEESLRETKKVQNTKGDLLTKVQKIYSAGLDIFAGFIVGFDSDDKSIFERQLRFIESSGIIVAMVALLTALPKTPLHKRLREAGRLKAEEKTDNLRPFTNILPMQMTTDELIEGYLGLHHRLIQDSAIHRRIANKLRYLKDPDQYSDLPLAAKLSFLSRLFFKGILPGGPKRVYYFLRSLGIGVKNPKVLSMIFSDWISALALKSFAQRHYERPAALGVRAKQYFEKKLLWRAPQQVSLTVSESAGAERVMIGLKEGFDARLIRALAKSINRYVRKCRGSIVVDFRGIRDSGIAQLRPFFFRLKDYGNQVHLYITEGIYQKFQQELAGFQFTLAPASA